MMSLQEHKLQELIGAQQRKWIHHPEVYFTLSHPANWRTQPTPCTNRVQVQ